LDLAERLGAAVRDQLPGHAYCDERIFESELTTIFRSTWHLAGHESEIAKPGDFTTVHVGADPLVLWRAGDGSIRAYHNVCPHRGMRLLDGKGACETIVCPYHAWTFDQEGAALSIPRKAEMAPVCAPAPGLAPATVELWRGWVFVHPSPPLAVPLGDALAGFPAFLDQYAERYEELREVARVSFDEAVNWKIIVENYVEDYHFGYVHPKTLRVFDFKGVRTLPTGDHIRVYMPYRAEPPGGDCKYPWEPNGGSYQGYLFPGATFQTAKNHVSIFRIVPMAPERTRIEIPVYQTPSQSARFPVDVAALEADIRNDMEEDFVICRALQSNVRSQRFHTQALAGEHELGVAHFQSVWRRYLAGALERGA